MKQNLREYKGLRIASTAVIFENKKQREFYICGSNFQTGKTTVRYIDTGEYVEIATEVLSPYMENQRILIDSHWKSKKIVSKKPEHGSYCELFKPI